MLQAEHIKDLLYIAWIFYSIFPFCLFVRLAQKSSKFQDKTYYNISFASGCGLQNRPTGEVHQINYNEKLKKNFFGCL